MLFVDLQWETKYQKKDLRISEDRRKRKKEAWFSYMMKHLRNGRMEGLSLIRIESHVHTWWCPFVPYCHLKSTKEEEDRKWKKEEWFSYVRKYSSIRRMGGSSLAKNKSNRSILEGTLLTHSALKKKPYIYSQYFDHYHLLNTIAFCYQGNTSKFKEGKKSDLKQKRKSGKNREWRHFRVSVKKCKGCFYQSKTFFPPPPFSLCKKVCAPP